MLLLQSQVRPGKIDQKVIDGHIIANHVLFTNPTPDDVKYQSMAFTDMLKVMISFKKEVEGKDVRGKKNYSLLRIFRYSIFT